MKIYNLLMLESLKIRDDKPKELSKSKWCKQFGQNDQKKKKTLNFTNKH